MIYEKINFLESIVSRKSKAELEFVLPHVSLKMDLVFFLIFFGYNLMFLRTFIAYKILNQARICFVI